MRIVPALLLAASSVVGCNAAPDAVTTVDAAGSPAPSSDARADTHVAPDARGATPPDAAATLPDAPATDGSTAADAGPPSTGAPTSATFTPTGIDSTAMVPNPDRGMALWAGMDMISDSASVAMNVSATFAAGARMVYCTIDLQPYLGTTIPASALATLQSSYDAVRAGGVKCMSLVAYGVFTGKDPGESLTDITTHAAQLAPVFHKNADVIPYAKMGFVGEYGQWFNSTQTGAGALTCSNNDGTGPGPCPNAAVTANQLTVRDAILAAYAETTMLGFTTSSIPYGWAGGVPISQATAFQNTPLARVGIEDDCPLTGSGTPLVSQGDTGVFNYDVYNSATTPELIAFTEAQSRWSAFFGEFSDGCTPDTTDCADALKYVAAFHAASFKMIGWNTTQTGGAGPWGSAWLAGGCFYTIMNGFGSSLQLDSVTHPSTAHPGESVAVDVSMRNIGDSIVFTTRQVLAEACLVAAPHTCYGAPASPDLRELPPQATASSTVTATIGIPLGAATGAYQLRLSVPDIFPTTQSRPFMMRFVNKDAAGQTWDDPSGTMLTGTTLTVM